MIDEKLDEIKKVEATETVVKDKIEEIVGGEIWVNYRAVKKGNVTFNTYFTFMYTEGEKDTLVGVRLSRKCTKALPLDKKSFKIKIIKAWYNLDRKIIYLEDYVIAEKPVKDSDLPF